MASKRILVLSYMISPTRGSEYSVAWNYVVNMSKDNKLMVIYGLSGDHMGDTSELEDYVKNNPVENARFVAIKPNRLANFLNSLNKKGVLVYTFYLAYNIWHRQAYHKAKYLIKEEHFDLVHYLGPIGYREPGFLWKLKLPYMWGPVEGAPNVSFKLLKALPLPGIVKLCTRAAINFIQLRINPRLKKALDRVDVLMTATTENQGIFKNIIGKDSIYLPENGIIENHRLDATENLKKKKNNEEKIRLIWIGQIDSRKALIILLESLIKMKFLSQIELNIVGDGNLKNSLMDFSEKNNLANIIIWHGAVKRESVFELLSNAHIHIITSVSEGNPTTIWEAMSLGVPTISLDHCGMHDTICENCGIKIPIISYAQVVRDIAFHLDRLCTQPQEIDRLFRGVRVCAEKYTWAHRQIFFNKMYERAIENYNKRSLNE